MNTSTHLVGKPRDDGQSFVDEEGHKSWALRECWRQRKDPMPGCERCYDLYESNVPQGVLPSPSQPVSVSTVFLDFLCQVCVRLVQGGVLNDRQRFHRECCSLCKIRFTLNNAATLLKPTRDYDTGAMVSSKRLPTDGTASRVTC